MPEPQTGETTTRTPAPAFRPESGPSPFLTRNSRFFSPGHGKRALDVAVWDGGNSVFLAKLGYYVEAMGPSREALQKAAHKAEKGGVHLKLITGDPGKYKVQKDNYDLAICFYHVDRNAILQMKQCLRSEGIVVMESFAQDQSQSGNPVPEELILKPKELLFFFKDFNVLKYEEKIIKGSRSIAGIVAKKVKNED